MKVIEQVGDGGYRWQGDDWDSDSDSEDNHQIVVNDNFMIGSDRRSRMGVNNEDDEEPLVIVADTDPNQPMEEKLWGDDWSSSGGYHPFNSQFKVSVSATMFCHLLDYFNGRVYSHVGPVIDSVCVSPLYLYLKLNANAEYVDQRKLEVWVSSSLHSCFCFLNQTLECLVISLRTWKGVKNLMVFLSSYIYAILCHYQSCYAGFSVKCKLSNWRRGL